MDSKIAEWERATLLELPSEVSTLLRNALLHKKPEIVLVDSNLSSLPEVFNELPFLKRLTLIMPSLIELPNSLCSLGLLERLQILQCRELKEISLQSMPGIKRLHVFEGSALERLILPRFSGVRLHLIDCPKLSTAFPLVSHSVQVRSSHRKCLVSLAQRISIEHKVYDIAFAYFHLFGEEKPFSGVVEMQWVRVRANGKKNIYRLQEVDNRESSCILALFDCATRAQKAYDKQMPLRALSNESKRYCALMKAELLRAHLLIPESAEKGFVFEDYSEGDLYNVIELTSSKNNNFSVSVENKKRMARSLLSTLCECHEKNIAHRDIKPENIFIKKEEGEFVAVFGDFDGLVYPDYIERKLEGLLHSAHSHTGIGSIWEDQEKQAFCHNKHLPEIGLYITYGLPHSKNFVPSTLAWYVTLLLKEKLQVAPMFSSFSQSSGNLEAHLAAMSLEEREFFSGLVLSSSKVYDCCAIGISLVLFFLDLDMSKNDHPLNNTLYTGEEKLFFSNKKIPNIFIKQCAPVASCLLEKGLSRYQVDLLMRLIKPYALLGYYPGKMIEKSQIVKETYENIPLLEEVLNAFN